MHRTFSAVAAVAVFSVSTLAVAWSARPSPVQPPPRRSSDPCSNLPSRWQRAQCWSFHHSAPGDEYFGRMKMSYLGIDNTAHDVAIEAGDNTTDPGLIARLNFADEALRQWEQRYPGDPQLARSYFMMARAWRKVYTITGQQLAWQYMQHVLHVYPNTVFARYVRNDLARGFTEHWYAVAQICPTPSPTPNPRERAPEPTPTPEPSPTQSPTPTPPGQPKIDIITPPCVQATPVPQETPQAYPTEMPTESPSEVPTESPNEMPTETPTEMPSEAPARSPSTR